MRRLELSLTPISTPNSQGCGLCPVQPSLHKIHLPSACVPLWRGLTPNLTWFPNKPHAEGDCREFSVFEEGDSLSLGGEDV
ncbi:hypothetical protein CC2G_011399 [Coprinopsis cinerea AmutBmut pab1-1]|nr:hypothetical protein CC2G_011399 [Coprinopsis cinerea AmutBmut pab1-1]